MFGERGKFIISGGNDKSVKVWDWSRYFDAGQSNGNDNPHLNINLSKKVISHCIFSENFLDLSFLSLFVSVCIELLILCACTLAGQLALQYSY